MNLLPTFPPKNMAKSQKKMKTSPNHTVIFKNVKKYFLSQLRGILERVRNESEMWYLVSERKNMGSAEISVFGRNFCHFRSRRSIFAKNVGKFRKIVKNPFFQKCDKFIFWPLFLPKCVPKSVFYSKVAISTKEKWLIFEITFFPQISCPPPSLTNLFL